MQFMASSVIINSIETKKEWVVAFKDPIN
jgi:hypothetical protein